MISPTLENETKRSRALAILHASWRAGRLWGALMFLALTIVPMIRHKRFDLSEVIIGAFAWSIGALSFGYWVNRSARKRSPRN